MYGVYFSGTGNTKFCVQKFIEFFGKGEICSIEEKNASEKIKSSDKLVFAYPVYYSNMPKIVRDFIVENKNIWKNKKIFIIVTMGLFSGDGAGVSARLLKKYGAEIIGGLHIKMPDAVCDVRALKRSYEENKKIVERAVSKIRAIAADINKGKVPQDGLGIFCCIAGLLGQRLYFYNKTRNYSDKLKINSEKCIGCGKCVQLCPMKNISVRDNKAKAGNRCTMCYRCISKCPEKAITLIGKNVVEQVNIEKYL